MSSDEDDDIPNDKKPLIDLFEHEDGEHWDQRLIRAEGAPRNATKISIATMISLGFLTNMVATIVMPSLPQYLESLGAPGYLNGWVLSATGVATAISNPILGYWSDKRGVKEVCFFSLTLAAVANLWYAISGDFYQVVAARFLAAVAFGMQASANSFLSYATSLEDRAMFMTLSYGLGAFGFICGAAMSALTTLPIFQVDHVLPFLNIRINALTLPGFIAAALYALTLIPLIFFQNVQKPVSTELSEIRVPGKRCSALNCCADFGPGGVSLPGVLTCLFFVFATLAANASFVTIAPLFTADNPHLSFGVLDNALTFLSVGIGAVLTFVALQGFIRFVKDERISMILFGAILNIGFLLLIDWVDFRSGYIGFPQFVAALVFYAVGITASESFTWIVYSKLLEGTEQGAMMGWIGTTSAMAGVVSPLLAAYTYKAIGPNFVFLGVAVMSSLALVSVSIFFKSLHPRLHSAGEIEAVY